jgi:putative restriction endonuclease
MIKIAFIDYIKATNITGSQKANSYIKAIDILNLLLIHEPYGFNDCTDVWKVESVERLHQLYLFVLQQSKKKENNLWQIEGVAKSYLANGFCSAALKFFMKFLVEFKFEQILLNSLNEEKNMVPSADLNYPNCLLDGIEHREGREVVREVNVRTNQNVFRKVILNIYNQSCCITGLNIPEINRASHIVPWVEDKKIRLDPANGLCLSATYDAAFDKHLISLDDDYRIIISKHINDFYTSKSINEYFIKKQGVKINLPNSYKPKKSYLEIHRNNCIF